MNCFVTDDNIFVHSDYGLIRVDCIQAVRIFGDKAMVYLNTGREIEITLTEYQVLMASMTSEGSGSDE